MRLSGMTGYTPGSDCTRPCGQRIAFPRKDPSPQTPSGPAQRKLLKTCWVYPPLFSMTALVHPPQWTPPKALSEFHPEYPTAKIAARPADVLSASQGPCLASLKAQQNNGLWVPNRLHQIADRDSSGVRVRRARCKLSPNPGAALSEQDFSHTPMAWLNFMGQCSRDNAGETGVRCVAIMFVLGESSPGCGPHLSQIDPKELSQIASLPSTDAVFFSRKEAPCVKAVAPLCQRSKLKT